MTDDRHHPAPLSRAPRRPRLARQAISLLSLLVASFAVAPLGASDCPTEAGRSIRFLIGSWSVLDASGAEVGRTTIEPAAGGCALQERWRAGSVSGAGLMVFDPGDTVWLQLGGSSDGRTTSYRGEVEQGTLQLEGDHSLPDGSQLSARALFTPQADGTVRHTLELSRDGGAVPGFEGLYVPVGTPGRDRPPTTASASAPAAPSAAPPDDAAPASASSDPGVRATSRTRSSAEIAPAAPVRVEPLSAEAELEDREVVEMASPMVLRVPLGPVEKLPEGYAWSSREVSRYVVEQVSISLLRASLKRQRGRVRLTVDLDLIGRAFRQVVDLQVALRDADGEVVSTAEVSGEAVGRSLPAQSQDGSVRKSLQLEIDTEAFQAALEAASRPELEIQVDVR